VTPSEPVRALLLARRLGAAAALIVAGVAVASALGSGAAAEAGPAAGAVAGAARPPSPPPARPAAPADPCARARSPGAVNINDASAAELQRLPGIGPARAARIIEYRSHHGRFLRLRDLRRVKGIGPRTLERLRPLLRLDGPTTQTEPVEAR